LRRLFLSVDLMESGMSGRLGAVTAVITAVATALGVIVGIAIGKGADETARNIGINNLLAQLENVMDSHQGTRACSRYVVHFDLVEELIRSKPVQKLPDDDGDKAQCLGGIYRHVTFDKEHPIPTATEWDYLREQITSYLNIVDLAASYTTAKSYKETKKRSKVLPSEEKGLVRMLNGIVDEDSVALMHKWAEVENRIYKKSETLEEIWGVCRVVDCGKDMAASSH